jgi:hypothetical protein
VSESPSCVYNINWATPAGCGTDAGSGGGGGGDGGSGGIGGGDVFLIMYAAA